MSWVKKSLIALAVLVVALGAALAFFVYTFDANKYRGFVLEQLRRSVNRPVEAADLELQLFPLRLRLNQVRIPEDPGFAGKEFIRAEAVQFDFSLLALLRGETQVQALELVEPVIHLRQNAAGRWNAATLAAKEEEPAAPAAGPRAAPVRNWRIENGTLILERADQPPLRLTGVELALADISPTQAFPFRLAVRFSSDSRLQAAGELGPLDLDTPVRTPVQAEVTLESFRPAALSSLVSVPPELARLGTLEGTATLRSGAEQVGLKGEITLVGAEGADDLKLRINALLPPDFSCVKLEETAIEYARATVRGNGAVVLEPAVSFDLAVRTSDADLNGLLGIPPRMGYSLPASLPPIRGRLTSDLKLSGKPKDWQAEGTAGFRHLEVELDEFPEPVRVDSLNLTLAPGRLEVAPSNLTLPPGVNLTVAGTVKDYRSEPRIDGRVTAGELALGPLLALARQFGVSLLPEGPQVSGYVQPTLNLAGPLAEPASMSYDGTLKFRELSLTTPELAQPVRVPSMVLSLSPEELSAPPFTARVGEALQARLNFGLRDYQTRPSLTAHGETENADLAALLGLVRSLGSDPLPGGRARGRVTVSLDAKGTLGEKAPPPALSGSARLTEASVHPASLREPLEIKQADVELAPDRLEITNLRMTTAGSSLQGALEVRNFDAPRVSFDWEGDNLDLDRLERQFAGTPEAAPVESRLRRLLEPTVHAQEKASDWFARLRGRGRVRFGRVTRGELAFAPFSAPVVISNQVITCDPIDFGLYEGGGRGRLVVDLRRDEPVVEFSGLLRNVDAEKLLAATSESEPRLRGRLGGRLDVRFTGSERERIIRSATGEGQMSLVDGRLTAFNLGRKLATVLKLAGLRFHERETPVEQMGGTFRLADGWARTDDFTLRTPELTVDAVGGFSLEDELAFEAAATFSPEASRRVQSRRGLLGSVTSLLYFKDEQGRVVAPFLVRGAFADPDIKPDAGRLAEMKLGGGRGRERDGSLKEILDRLRGREPD